MTRARGLALLALGLSALPAPAAPLECRLVDLASAGVAIENLPNLPVTCGAADPGCTRGDFSRCTCIGGAHASCSPAWRGWFSATAPVRAVHVTVDGTPARLDVGGASLAVLRNPDELERRLRGRRPPVAVGPASHLVITGFEAPPTITLFWRSDRRADPSRTRDTRLPAIAVDRPYCTNAAASRTDARGIFGMRFHLENPQAGYLKPDGTRVVSGAGTALKLTTGRGCGERPICVGSVVGDAPCGTGGTARCPIERSLGCMPAAPNRCPSTPAELERCAADPQVDFENPLQPRTNLLHPEPAPVPAKEAGAGTSNGGS